MRYRQVASTVCDLSIWVKVLWLAHLLLEKDIIPTFKWSIDKSIRADDLKVFLLQNLSSDSKSANTSAGQTDRGKKGTSPNMMRFEKTVISALCVHLILAVGKLSEIEEQ